MTPVIVTFCDAGYIPVTQNWLSHLAVLRMENDALIVTLDEPTEVAFSTSRTLHRPMAREAADLQPLWMHRIEVLQEILQSGRSVVHSDSDAVWQQDPLPDIEAVGASIIFSQGTIWPPDVHALHRVVLCCGFFYLACDTYAWEFLGAVGRRVRTDKDDQISVNREVASRITGWEMDAPYCIQFGADHFLASRQPMTAIGKCAETGAQSISVLPHHAYPRLIDEVSDEIVVAHPFSGKTLAHKQRRLEELGLWKMTPPQRAPFTRQPPRDTDAHALRAPGERDSRRARKSSRPPSRGLARLSIYPPMLPITLHHRSVRSRVLAPWEEHVASLSDVRGVPIALTSTEQPPPSPDEAFTLISSPAALTEKLLYGAPPIHILPADPAQPTAQPSLRARTLPGTPRGRKRLTLITSVFNADRFLSRFLGNIAALRGYADFEHFLIRPGSPGNEHEALLAHVLAYPETAVYINLPTDPGLYEVWNLGARLSSAPYLSNANIDDQRAPDHAATLIEVLDRTPEVDVASTAIRVTDDPLLEWEQSDSCPVWFASEGTRRYGFREMFNARRGGFAIRDIPHCMPMWRRSLHPRFGFFNEHRYGPSADSEFWLRVGSAGARFLIDDTPLGLYLRDPVSYWSRGSNQAAFIRRIRETYTPEGDGFAAPIPEPLSFRFAELRTLADADAHLELASRLLLLATSPMICAKPSVWPLLSRLTRRYLATEPTGLSQPPLFPSHAFVDHLSATVRRCLSSAPDETGLAGRVLRAARSDAERLPSVGAQSTSPKSLLQRTSSPPTSPDAAKSNSPTQSEYPSR